HITPGTVAAHAGLKSGDQIVAANNERTPTWEAANLAIIDQALKQGEVMLTVRDPRGGTRQRVLDVRDPRQVLNAGNLLKSLGITPWQPAIAPVLGKLTPDGAARQSGLRPGDRIISANGRVITQWQDWVNFVRAHPNESVSLVIKRGGDRMRVNLHTDVVREDGRRIGRIGAYPHVNQARLDAMQVEVRYNPVSAFGMAIGKTWDFSALTVRILWKLIMGEASLRNVSGPITIAEYAGVSAVLGLSAFLGALAVFSISIGVLNLLPVPVLDGGHLLYYFIELVKGSPVSETAEAVGQRIGLAVLAGLMALAFYNDFARLIG
ncbi:MAG: RIP metalloprotease RseP, partial [Pseudomonadota bacterium]|nr:RIP metalloprotease RseP [Pseudomonadota bacterium]